MTSTNNDELDRAVAKIGNIVGSKLTWDELYAIATLIQVERLEAEKAVIEYVMSIWIEPGWRSSVKDRLAELNAALATTSVADMVAADVKASTDVANPPKKEQP